MPEKSAALRVQIKQPGAKEYPPEQTLTPQEIRSEGDNLIHEFIDLFRENPGIQRCIVEAFSDFDRGRMPGSIVFEKGSGRYILKKIGIGEMTSDDKFELTRTEGNLEETLSVKRVSGDKVLEKPSIVYLADPNSGSDVFKRYDGKLITKNNAATVNKARELLTKTKKDFAPTQAPATA